MFQSTMTEIICYYFENSHESTVLAELMDSRTARTVDDSFRLIL